jgi:pyruvate formate lyase activating enzyme
MVMAQTVSKNASDLKGLVFNIERFSVHDGPGIRTLVFLKGCPLSCRWCANPEGIAARPQVVFLPESCIGCASCKAVCPEDAIIRTSDGMITMASEHCNHCGTCVTACPSLARKVYGRSMSINEVFEEIYKDFPFYRRSGGGVTLSGGEPLMQKEFTYALLKFCSQHHIHTAAETCGFADWETVSHTFEFADLILFDFKHVHPLKHTKFTGVDNGKILENMRKLNEQGKDMIIRVPVIPGFNDSAEEMESMAKFISQLKRPPPCHLLPYHALGVSKYKHLGTEPKTRDAEGPSKETMQEFLGIWNRHGIATQIGG